MRIPWWFNLSAKLVLSGLPIPYSVWRRLNLFRHGAMQNVAYATSVFSRHYTAATALAPLPPDFVALEIGPGDSLLGALIARTRGAARAIAIDSGRFADDDVASYERSVRSLGSDHVFTLDKTRDFDEFLALNRITYLTEGLRSFAAIPDASVHLIWSHATLEHIPRLQFRPLLAEMRRVLRADGVMSHRVDLQDHLGGALNNLRFPERVWESRFVRNAGFYTNRLRYHEILDALNEVGFTTVVTETDRWRELPTPRTALSRQFRGYPMESLLTSGFQAVSRRSDAIEISPHL